MNTIHDTKNVNRILDTYLSALPLAHLQHKMCSRFPPCSPTRLLWNERSFQRKRVGEQGGTREHILCWR